MRNKINNCWGKSERISIVFLMGDKTVRSFVKRGDMAVLAAYFQSDRIRIPMARPRVLSIHPPDRGGDQKINKSRYAAAMFSVKTCYFLLHDFGYVDYAVPGGAHAPF